MEEDRLIHPRDSANPTPHTRRPKMPGLYEGHAPAERPAIRALLSPTATKAQFV